jgi:FeS assembly SUF system regulator
MSRGVTTGRSRGEETLVIRITRETDYGIVLLSHLASGPNDRIQTARDLSSWAGLPLPMVSKILKGLARAGILVSHRGAKGGYSLARHPEDVSVGDVIRALEGPVGITECASTPGSCEQESVCPIRCRWQEISSAVREFLEKIPISHLLHSAPLPQIQGSGID